MDLITIQVAAEREASRDTEVAEVGRKFPEAEAGQGPVP